MPSFTLVGYHFESEMYEGDWYEKFSKERPLKLPSVRNIRPLYSFDGEPTHVMIPIQNEYLAAATRALAEHIENFGLPTIDNQPNKEEIVGCLRKIADILSTLERH